MRLYVVTELSLFPLSALVSGSLREMFTDSGFRRTSRPKAELGQNGEAV